MVEHEVSIRKCEICRRYFLPHSKASRYCDRLVDDHAGKTCQDIGAMTKYQEKINGDLAKKLYIKVDNRIQTWVGRHKENGLYRLKYLKWKDEAKQCLEDVRNGRLSFEEFEGMIDHKPEEALGRIELSEEEIMSHRKAVKNNVDGRND